MRVFHARSCRGNRIGAERDLQDLAVLRSKRATWSEHVQITKLGDPCEDGKRLCCVSLGYSITNIGQARMEVTYVLVRAYRARLPQLDPNSAIRVNAVCEKGDLDWLPLLCRGCYYTPKWKEGLKHEFRGQKHSFQKGGGGTAELDAGDSSSGELTVLVMAGPEDLIGFHAIIGFDGGKTDDDRWEITEWAHFAEKDSDVPQNEGETQ